MAWIGPIVKQNGDCPSVSIVLQLYKQVTTWTDLSLHGYLVIWGPARFKLYVDLNSSLIIVSKCEKTKP